MYYCNYFYLPSSFTCVVVLYLALYCDLRILSHAYVYVPLILRRFLTLAERIYY